MTDNATLPEQPFLSHLIELRDRLMRMMLAILVIFIGLFPFGNDIYIFIADPLMRVLPEGTSMIATQVASPFLTPFKLALVTAVFVAMPYLLHQFWAFIAPGLYQHEKRLALPLLASSVLLFYLGAAFAYAVVFPLVFGFMTRIAPEGVSVMTDINRYLDFVIALFLAFGLIIFFAERLFSSGPDGDYLIEVTAGQPTIEGLRITRGWTRLGSGGGVCMYGSHATLKGNIVSYSRAAAGAAWRSGRRWQSPAIRAVCCRHRQKGHSRQNRPPASSERS